MFTGIVEETGIVREIKQGRTSSKLSIEAVKIIDDMNVGDSINTNGVCLTVTDFGKGFFTTDVIPETLRRTGLGSLKMGSTVNLERALRLMDRLGGHLVTGHIDGTGKIGRRWQENNAVWFSIHAEETILRYIVEKGSVALDGISLTVTSAGSGTFCVSVIPHTQKVTTILQKKAGDLMNIECDILAKYIENLHASENGRPKIDLDFLTKNNFL